MVSSMYNLTLSCELSHIKEVLLTVGAFWRGLALSVNSIFFSVLQVKAGVCLEVMSVI